MCDSASDSLSVGAAKSELSCVVTGQLARKMSMEDMVEDVDMLRCGLGCDARHIAKVLGIIKEIYLGQRSEFLRPS